MQELPVLLLTWRRPDATQRVLEVLRKVKPSTLYVASDGPRHKSDWDAIQCTRATIEKLVDWPCLVKKRYLSSNLGPGLSQSSSIDWFFGEQIKGLILEDDCIPHPDLFPFCSELLNRYEMDMRVWTISGSNHQLGRRRGNASYFFSRYHHSWGWATWRSRWQEYSQASQIWETLVSSTDAVNSLLDNLPSDLEAKYWMEKWIPLFVLSKPNWDYRWLLVCMANNGLTIIPNENLVENIGFGKDATHTTQLKKQGQLPERFFLRDHPICIYPNSQADQFTFDYHYGGLQLKKDRRLHNQILRRLRLIVTNPMHYIRKLNCYARGK